MQPKIIYSIDCNIVLPTYLISFKGTERTGLGALQWVSANETAGVSFTVERSDDGSNFYSVGIVQGQAAEGAGSYYQFTDARPLSGQVYYRVRLNAGSYQRYSSQVLLSSSGFDFGIRSMVNPFTDHISIDMTSPAEGTVQINLLDMYGRMIRQIKQPVSQGLNNINIYGLGSLPVGTYALQMQYGDQSISKKLIKLAK
jgi:hypothetical protein